jgi:ferredoxin--NADP+ reductase
MLDGTGMCGTCRLHEGDQVKFCCVDGPDFDGHKVDFDELIHRQNRFLVEEKAILKKKCKCSDG